MPVSRCPHSLIFEALDLFRLRVNTAWIMALLATVVTLAGAAPSIDFGPIPLDPVFEDDGVLTMKSAGEFAARFPQFKIPRIAVLPKTGGFNEVPRLTGRPLTLFGLPVDDATFVFRGRELYFVNAQFLGRGRSVSISQPDFQKLITLCIDAVSAKTGVTPVNELKPERPGSAVSQWCRWPTTQFFLNYSYSVPDLSRGIPFRAEYVSLRLPRRH